MVAPNSAVLECRIDLGEPEAKVRCFKDTKEIYSGTKYQIAIDGESVKLVVSNTELTDASKYKCEAANKVGKVETAAQLTVHSTWILILSSDLSYIYCCGVCSVKFNITNNEFITFAPI